MSFNDGDFSPDPAIIWQRRIAIGLVIAYTILFRAHPATRRPATQAFKFKARRDEEVNSHSRPRSNEALELKALRPGRRHLPFLGEAAPINSTNICRGGRWVAGCALDPSSRISPCFPLP
ncbi:MAG: hypothetical protein Q7R22_008930 [Verrucomicrobiota bacterium JB025]|nr:hypothetical protein [Verrucomicrobiota bacterium JB025]